MKNIITILGITIFLISCNNSSNENDDENSYEHKINNDEHLTEYYNFTTSSSSILPSQSGYNYNSNNVADNIPETWWSPTQEDKEPWIKLYLSKNILVKGISIHGGAHYENFKNYGNLYYKNHRAKRIKVKFDNGVYKYYNLRDVDRVQEIRFKPVETSSLTIYIIDVWQTDKWPDICISHLKPLI